MLTSLSCSANRSLSDSRISSMVMSRPMKCEWAMTLFQAFDFFRVTVTGENHLLAAFEQGVEGVEKLFLGTLFLGEELNVIDQQCVHRTVEALELVDRIQVQGLDHVRDETLGMQVHHLGIRVLRQ